MWVIGVPAGFAMWALISSVPDVVVGLVGFGAFTLALAVLYHVRRSLGWPSRDRDKEHHIPPGLDFYTSRDDFLDHIKGGLRTELAGVGYADVSFETGTFYIQLDDLLKKKIRHLVLVCPETEYIERWTSFDETTRIAKEQIILATKQAQAAGSKVRWCTGPILNAVFGEPESDLGWVRVQAQMPYVKAAKWPSYRITKKENPDFFRKVTEAYEATWNASDMAPTQ